MANYFKKDSFQAKTNLISKITLDKNVKNNNLFKVYNIKHIKEIYITMGWFNKKDKKDEVPKLAELPKLPALPPMRNSLPSSPDPNSKEIHQLPSFPNNKFGEQLSQNTIKEAITGGKGDMVPSANNMPTLPQLNSKLTMEIEDEESGIKRNELARDVGISPDIFEKNRHMATDEPVFVRIDKFEESLAIFQKTKEKAEEIEKMLTDIKKIKEEEDKELNFWENEAQAIKEQIEKIDSKLFSKLE